MMSSGAGSPSLARSRALAIVQLPFEGGQPIKGVARGPDLLTSAGLTQQIQKLGWTVVDLAQTQVQLTEAMHRFNAERTTDGRLHNLHAVAEATRLASEVIAAELRRGRFCLNLGGDHSLGIATLSAVAQAHPDNYCVLWVDAHADVNTIETTPTGNLHGMPLSFVLGLNRPSNPPGFEWIRSVLPPDRLAYIGLRALDEGEKEIIRRLNIKAFSMHDVDQLGIGRVVADALQHINPHRTRHLHVSFDVDGLDPDVIPSTGTRVRGGLTLREGRFIAEECARSGTFGSLDIMEVNPSMDPLQPSPVVFSPSTEAERNRIRDALAAVTAQNALQVIRAALGEMLV